ncbi:hypothetical protein [Methylocystis heyeri]|uniref:DUF3168 domain-containing protein n=1 Tax=Methylocystis heyeri TaxID=391905 RepID=A0A6B8KFQ8_9HYPH|nr:hypothetical protein [Methylocystis heyeri]QGM45831.1 hypothetical protein H2LOC_009025 [Methylocystis heyeri]
MNIPREAIVSALMAKLGTVAFAAPVNGKTGFATVSRRLKLWSDTPKSQRPALFVTEHREQQSWQSEALPPKTTLCFDLFVYIDASDLNTTPAVSLNTIMDAIEAALKPGPGEGDRQTLGGLVSHCRIDGQILKDPGDLDGDGMLWAPLKILAL